MVRVEYGVGLTCTMPSCSHSPTLYKARILPNGKCHRTAAVHLPCEFRFPDLRPPASCSLRSSTVDTLEELGQLLNTYFIFTSDNGYQVGRGMPYICVDRHVCVGCTTARVLTARGVPVQRYWCAR